MLDRRIDRRRFLRGLAATGAAILSLGQTAPAVGRELYWDEDYTVPEGPPAGLYRLLRYLGVDYDSFRPHEVRYFTALRDLLAESGVVSREDTLGRANFAAALERFQLGGSLPESGISTEDTLWALQAGRARSRRLELVQVSADVWPGRQGLKRLRLRQDAALAYDRFRDEVRGLGGVVTSDGSMRELTDEVSPGRSATSLHYTGLAFDLATSTGMQNPRTDPYIVTEEGPGWHVWARAEGGVERALDAVLWRGGRTAKERVTARVIDFTALAVQHGFRDIGHRDCFPGSYPCAEWWHFQYEAALVPFVSQFGAELLSLRIYPESALKAASAIWDNRKLIRNRRPDGWLSTPGPRG